MKLQICPKFSSTIPSTFVITSSLLVSQSLVSIIASPFSTIYLPPALLSKSCGETIPFSFLKSSHFDEERIFTFLVVSDMIIVFAVNKRGGCSNNPKVRGGCGVAGTTTNAHTQFSHTHLFNLLIHNKIYFKYWKYIYRFTSS